MEDLCKEKFDTIIKNLDEIKAIVKESDAKHDKLNNDFLTRTGRLETQMKVLWWFFSLIGGSLISIIISGIIKL